MISSPSLTVISVGVIFSVVDIRSADRDACRDLFLGNREVDVARTLEVARTGNGERVCTGIGCVVTGNIKGCIQRAVKHNA